MESWTELEAQPIGLCERNRVNQALVDQNRGNVLAQLQSVPPRT